MGNRLSLALLMSVTMALVACEASSSHGETLMIVDTDLPVPQLAGRLRVDLYDRSGVWFESRDIGRPDRRDWPVSFGLYTDHLVEDHLVLVRLRTYPEGKVREYRGERFAKRPRFEAPRVAHTLAELCADPPVLKLGETITVRRGMSPLFVGFLGGDCEEWKQNVGSAAVAINIQSAGACDRCARSARTRRNREEAASEDAEAAAGGRPTAGRNGAGVCYAS